MSGHRHDELLGERVEILVPERRRERHFTHRTSYSAEPQTRSLGAGLELYAWRKDGTEFPVEISLRRLETDDGCSSRA